jgi:outer membrane protein assembly factor BamB
MIVVKRCLIILSVLLLILQPPTAQAAPIFQEFDTTTGLASASSQPQIIWELKGLGRLSADMQFAPNGQLLLPLAGQLEAVNTAPASGDPGLQWNVRTAGGSLGYPVCTANGSIYAPFSSSIQELEPDGASGWAFAAYPSTGGASDQWLGYGQGDLFLPLASGLYILDADGHLISLAPWDSSELQATKLPLHYNFLAGAVTAPASGSPVCYTVVSTDSDQYQMLAFDAEGNQLVDYGLSGLKQAYIAAGTDGTVFLATDPTINSKVSHDTVCSFAPGSSQPQWQTPIDENIDFLGLSLTTEGSLYLALAGKIYAIDPKTGAIKWDVLFHDLTSPVAVDNATGYIYAGCSDDNLIAVDPTGKLSWELSLDASISRMPLVGPDGFLYVATDSGNLYKIRIPSA